MSYENPVPAQAWAIDPATLGLVADDGSRGGTFMAQEFDAQTWPPCPVCGAMIEVDRVNVQEIGDRFPVFLMGKWQCPNQCDPRPVLRP